VRWAGTEKSGKLGLKETEDNNEEILRNVPYNVKHWTLLRTRCDGLNQSEWRMIITMFLKGKETRE
jgi:hypothetical protein